MELAFLSSRWAPMSCCFVWPRPALIAVKAMQSAAACAPLTSREAEVLLWMSRGKSNREIGAILDISPRTVNKHLEQVFMKLGVENRAAAAAAAVRTLS